MAQDAMRMDLYTAVDAIGSALRDLATTGHDGVFQDSLYPVPDMLDIAEGRPVMTVRFDGIAGDDWNRLQEMIEPPKSPSDLRFEVRIYHPPNIPSTVPYDTDPYIYAQEQVMKGTSEFYKNLRADNTLGDLVMDVLILGSVAGDLFDPRNNREFYGHEIMLVTSTY
jgi:hypothetical protein